MEKVALAIVGVSCRFAGAPDPGAFWRQLMRRRSALTPLGSAALEPGMTNLFDRPYPKFGGQLGDLYACVRGLQTFPRKLTAGENQDLYFGAQLALDALADAGLRRTEMSRGTVRLGYAPPFSASTVNWLQHTFFIDQTMDVIQSFFRTAPPTALEEVRRRLVMSLPEPNADSFLSGTGNRVAAHIARECSFSGGATTIDAGSLSCVAALRAAMDDLRSGRADVALVGAFTPPLNRSYLQGMSGLWRFSEDADLVPFDREAHGTIPGEGGAFFVLKREPDALIANDRIYALVRSLACGSLPLEDILSAAAERAEAPMHSIGLIEADGCGVPEDDAAEVEVVQRLWGEHRPGGALVGIGSVKGNVGNCFRASGAAALLKVALSLRRRVLPPQIPTPHPLDSLLRHSSSAYLLTDARPWITGDPKSPRRAAVLAHSGDGHRAAIILEEEPVPGDLQ